MTYEEAMQVRDRALEQHILYGKNRLQQIQERVNELVEQHDAIAREVQEMEKARDFLSSCVGLPAIEPAPEPEPETENESE